MCLGKTATLKIPNLSEIRWLAGQMTVAEVAARLRLATLERISRSWRPKTPAELPCRRVFTALADRFELRRVFAAADLIKPCLAEASLTMNGEFTLFGGFRYKAPDGMPDWHAAFPDGQRWSGGYSFDISPQPGDSRDIRFTWELSRHGDLAALSRAAYLSGDERYSERLAKLLSGWIDANPLLRGPNWMSALEAGVRAVTWAFIDDTGVLDAETTGRLRRALFEHGCYIERFLSMGLNPSNHIIGEAAGLFVCGLKFRETDQGRRWRGRAARILTDEMTRQTFDSGASREQSTAYHRFVAGLFGLCMAVGGRGEFSESFANRLQAMYGFLSHLSRPDGTFAHLGDSDEAVALRLAQCAPNDLRSDIAFGEALFAEAQSPAAASAPEAMWLLGPTGRRREHRVVWPPGQAGAPSPMCAGACAGTQASAFFPGAGLSVIKSADAAMQMEFDAGPQGYTPVSSHGHADALSVTLWKGAPRLIDAGTYRYNAARSWRDAFRGTHFHNTVMVDSAAQAKPASAFRWLSLADARPVGHFFSEEIDWSAGELPPTTARPWSHRRDVLRIGRDVCVIIDTVGQKGAHTAEAHFHFGDARLSPGRRGVEASYGDGGKMTLFSLNRAAEFDTVEHSMLADGAWQSASYGIKTPSSAVSATALFTDGIVLPWVLSFDTSGVWRMGAATHGAVAAEIRSQSQRYLFLVTPKGYVAHTGSLRFIGRWALVRLADGALEKAWAADAWVIEYAGKKLVNTIEPRDFTCIDGR